MVKNIDALAEYGERQLKMSMKEVVEKLRSDLYLLEMKGLIQYTNDIRDGNRNYKTLLNMCKEFGVEVPDLQKSYDLLLPGINHCLKQN